MAKFVANCISVIIWYRVKPSNQINEIYFYQ